MGNVSGGAAPPTKRAAPLNETPIGIEDLTIPNEIRTLDEVYSDMQYYTRSVWTVRETSFSGADIKAYLLVYGSRAKEILKSTLEAEKLKIERRKKETDLDIFETHIEGDTLADTLRSATYSMDAEVAIKKIDEELAKLTQEQLALLPLGELQTISISTHRDKMPVRALGTAYSRGYVRGSRTVAGSMIFTIFNHHPLAALLYGDMYSFEGYDHEARYELPDQLPPVDIMLLGVNEYGYKMRTVLYGVEFVNEGITFSIEDLFTESQMQFIARDWDPVREVYDLVTDKYSLINRIYQRPWGITGTDLIQDEDYERYKRRANPFL